jgi:predicted nucleic acid-binding protein
MKVLVDTSVWSLALRRRSQKPDDDPYVLELRELTKELRVQMIGPIRQEILSGIRSQDQFKALRNHLRMFPDLELTLSDYERAAELFNILRAKGIQGSNTDFLICAIAERHKFPILTTDSDFKLFQKHVHLSLHMPRPAIY